MNVVVTIINITLLSFVSVFCVIEGILYRGMKQRALIDLRKSNPEDYGEDLGDYWYEYYMKRYQYYKRGEWIMYILTGTEFICLLSYILVKILL